jgi:predicted enzyme related to lactoylglutathione lyase
MAADTLAIMAIRIQSTSFDCSDPSALASFWEAVLGWRRTYEDDDEVALEPPAGSREDGVVPDLLFLRVPEGKSVKNRLHLDLRPDNRDAEVERVIGLGATKVDVGQSADVAWVVLADPEGNEFCILRSLEDDERAEWTALYESHQRVAAGN